MVRGIHADLIDDVSAIALAKAEAFSDVGTMANVAVVRASGQASYFARHIAMVRSSGEASSDKVGVHN